MHRSHIGWGLDTLVCIKYLKYHVHVVVSEEWFLLTGMFPKQLQEIIEYILVIISVQVLENCMILGTIFIPSESVGNVSEEVSSHLFTG